MADIQLKDILSGLTEDTTPATGSDFLMTLDTSADALKKVKPSNLLTAANMPTAIDAAKLGGGAVSNTEFGYLDGVTSAIQAQLDAKATIAQVKSETLIIAISDETTALTTGTNKVTFRMPFGMSLSAVRASVTTAPTGATCIIDINEGGSSILSTKLSIDASEKTSTTAASAAVISDANLADDSEITIDIDQVGSTAAGAGLKVYLIGARV